MSARVGVLTVSDAGHRGERKDLSGPALAARASALGWRVCRSAVVPDEKGGISRVLRRWSQGPDALDLVFTTGGTGFGPRDVTPEATLAVIERQASGLSERMRREGEAKTPLASLSRGVCGLRKRTLILNLPGSPKGAVESFDAVAGILPHALEMMRGRGH
ncbi:MAG: MogA/MoaB family molybdenum cofactor biosynthesis protein [Elusimicrobiota bacterium]